MKYKFYMVAILSAFAMVGCAHKTPTAGQLLTLNETPSEIRQLQSKRFDTTNDGSILKASTAVLQDMGFGIGETSEELGSLTAEKERDAQEIGQNVFAYSMAFLAALGGNGSNMAYWMDQRDYRQVIRTNIVVSPAKQDSSRIVRVVFQRVVYSEKGAIRAVETISDTSIYQHFFQKLSKSIFLEGHDI